MVIRGAKYPRAERDHYETPRYVVRALLDHVPFKNAVIDPCSGDGNIVRELMLRYGHAYGLDLSNGFDFLADTVPYRDFDVLTNPPYGGGGRVALKFIERSLALTEPWRGKTVMLLQMDYDSGFTRRHVFKDCRAFSKKIVLLRRIKWFDGKSGSTNHSWFVWDWKHTGPATIQYISNEDEE